MEVLKSKDELRSITIEKAIDYGNFYKHSIPISQKKPYSKYINIVNTFPFYEHEISEYVELRLFRNGQWTRNGIFMTPKEYDWLTENLLFVNANGGRIRYPWNEPNTLQTSELRIIMDQDKPVITQKFKKLTIHLYLNQQDFNAITSPSMNTFDKLKKIFEEAQGIDEIDIGPE